MNKVHVVARLSFGERPTQLRLASLLSGNQAELLNRMVFQSQPNAACIFSAAAITKRVMR
jgi:hypothetical protein